MLEESQRKRGECPAFFSIRCYALTRNDNVVTRDGGYTSEHHTFPHIEENEWLRKRMHASCLVNPAPTAVMEMFNVWL